VNTADTRPSTEAAAGPAVALAAEGLTGGRLRALDIKLRRGEILGIAGLLGSGAEDVPGLLFGALPATAGTLTVGGRAVPAPDLTPRRAIGLGIGLVPADRAGDGLIGELSVWENELFLVNRRYFRRGWPARRLARADARQRSARFRISPPDVDNMVGRLSGGNQQKVLIAKWCEIGPSVLLLHEPTQGVDIGARMDIHQAMKQLADAGTAIVWATTDYAEMAQMADRVLIFTGGVVGTELHGGDVTLRAISAAVVSA
jgi:ribose transport system ATP-binding protein